VSGMRVRGGASAYFEWSEYKVRQLVLTASESKPCRLILKVPDGQTAKDLYGNEFPTTSEGFMYVDLKAGESLHIRF